MPPPTHHNFCLGLEKTEFQSNPKASPQARYYKLQAATYNPRATRAYMSSFDTKTPTGDRPDVRFHERVVIRVVQPGSDIAGPPNIYCPRQYPGAEAEIIRQYSEPLR